MVDVVIVGAGHVDAVELCLFEPGALVRVRGGTRFGGFSAGRIRRPLSGWRTQGSRAGMIESFLQPGDRLWGEPPRGIWATSRAEALRRLDHAVAEVSPRFGPHEDAMVSTSWHLAHTLLSPYRAGDVPVASAEGLSMPTAAAWRQSPTRPAARPAIV
jgi:hypothetical protein